MTLAEDWWHRLRYTQLAVRDHYLTLIKILDEYSQDSDIKSVSRFELAIRAHVELPEFITDDNFKQFVSERIDIVARWFGWDRKNENGRVVYYLPGKVVL